MDIVKAGFGDDIMIEKDSLKIYIQKSVSELLANATMDYQEGKGMVLSGIEDTAGG